MSALPAARRCTSMSVVGTGVEPVKRQRFEAFLQENPAVAKIQSEADTETLFRQFQAWAERNAQAQMGTQVDSKKVRDQDRASQSATQAAPPRHPPRRSHLQGGHLVP